MKKKNIIFSIVALLLASCNNANNDNSKTDESEKCTIEFYVYDNADEVEINGIQENFR